MKERKIFNKRKKKRNIQAVKTKAPGFKVNYKSVLSMYCKNFDKNCKIR